MNIRDAAPPRVVITGASGFVGGHLARLLARAGFAVSAPLRQAAAAEPLRAVGVTPLVGDLEDALAGADTLVHAAATSPRPQVDAARMVTDNVELTRRAIGAAVAQGVRRIVFLSSMSVYGEIAVPEVDETTIPVQPDLYGMTKLVGEALLADRAGEVAGMAIRLPAVIGAGAARHWLAETMRRLLANEDTPIFHPDGRFNNAVHVEDLAALIAGFVRGGEPGFTAVNVASDGSLKVREAVDILSRTLGSRSRIVEQPPRRPSFVISWARARMRFGFRPMPIAAALETYARDTLALAGGAALGRAGRGRA